MKYVSYFLLFLPLSIMLQAPIKTSLIKRSPFKADSFISKNNFETIYYIEDNALLEQTKERKFMDLGYSNFQLGNITSANTFNPLKINLFYKDFNTAVILDNRLSEIFKIEFNNQTPYKNVSHISTGHDNTLWVFNQDTQQLELFDYKTNSTRTQTLPIEGEILDLKSNYNTCFLLTKDYLYMYNYVGSLLKKIKHDGFTSFVESNNNVLFKKDNTLSYYDSKTDIISPIKLPNLLIKQFSVTNETLYIYDNETLHEYQLKLN